MDAITTNKNVNVELPMASSANVIDDLERDFNERYANDPEFRRVWNESFAERTLGDELTRVRIGVHMTQRDLSAKTGIAQGDISRIESARANPSLKTLKRIADGMGMDVKITFVPKKQE